MTQRSFNPWNARRIEEPMRHPTNPVVATEPVLRTVPGHTWRSYWLVAVCFCTIAISFLDRQILSLLAVPMQADLGLSDFQISLLGGVAFSLFYALFAIPLGRLIDGGNRPLILAMGILTWSVATLASGFARSFFMIFILRVAVSIGEGTASPCCVGMATDAFAGRSVGRAIALVMLGGIAGIGFALFGGGAIINSVQRLGHVTLPLSVSVRAWQVVFLASAVPGLLLAPIIAFTIRDPERRLMSADAVGDPQSAGFSSFFRFLNRNRAATAGLALGYSIWSIGEKALLFWAPTYLIRSFGMATGQAGYVFDTVTLGTMLAGNFLCGFLVDRGRKAGRSHSAIRLGRNAAFLCIIPAFAFPFMSSFAGSVAVLTLAMLFFSGYSTVTVAQALIAPNQVRAQFTGMYLLVSNIIGGVIGTSLVALVNEHLMNDRSMIGVSMAIVAGGASLLGASVLAWARRSYHAASDRLDRSAAYEAALLEA